MFAEYILLIDLSSNNTAVHDFISGNFVVFAKTFELVDMFSNLLITVESADNALSVAIWCLQILYVGMFKMVRVTPELESPTLSTFEQLSI